MKRRIELTNPDTGHEDYSVLLFENEYKNLGFQLSEIDGHFESAVRMGQEPDFDIEGYVKFDGCMDWTLNPAYAMHFCSDQCIDRLAQVFKAIRAEAPGYFGDRWHG